MSFWHSRYGAFTWWLLNAKFGYSTRIFHLRKREGLMGVRCGGGFAAGRLFAPLRRFKPDWMQSTRRLMTIFVDKRGQNTNKATTKKHKTQSDSGLSVCVCVCGNEWLFALFVKYARMMKNATVEFVSLWFMDLFYTYIILQCNYRDSLYRSICCSALFLN